MTLKEKFLNSPCEKGYINTNVYRAENNVKIADDYAIEFAEWICRKSGVPYIKGTMDNTLKIFKKEKQL